jgi:hypothetical protein
MRRDIWAELGRLRTRIWLGLLVAFGVGLAVTPLFDSLGFESCFALAIPSALAGADLAAARARRLVAAGELAPGAGTAFRLARISVPVALLLPLGPLVVLAGNAVRVRQCDWGFGVRAALYLPLCAALFGALTGVVTGLLLRHHRRLAAAAPILVIALSLGLGVWRFYAAPPIFGYDPYAGYFPGTIYDEEVGFSAAFAWARLYHLAGFGFAVGAAMLVEARRGGTRRPTLSLAVPTVGAFALALGLLLNSGALGFAVSAADMAEALGGVRETEHFVIHYPKDHPEIAPLIDVLTEEHELRLAQVSARLGAAPRRKIHSYYFATAEDKARWMGAKNTYIAKPWRAEIYIQHEGFPHPTLRHEIAHVVAGEFGDSIFRVSVGYWGWPPFRFNVGLIEGIAVAADWPGGSGRLTPHQAVRAMKELGLLPPLRRLLRPGFFDFSPAQSYTTAGSFVYFLLERYGPTPLRALYRSGGDEGDFARVYGKPLGTLEAEWHEEVAKAPISDEDLAVARERFRRRAIFSRPCPHAVAERLARARAQLGRGDATAAVATLTRVCKDDPGEPGHVLALAAAHEAANQLDAAVRAYQGLADDDGTRYAPPLRARALLRWADLEARRQDLASAAALIDRALALGIDEDLRRNLLVRRRAFGADPNQAGAAALRAYLVPPTPPPNPTKTASAAEDLQLGTARALPSALGALGHFLLGRLVLARGGPGAATAAAASLAEAARVGAGDPWFDGLVARENDRLLAKAAFLAGDVATARLAATRLTAPEQPLAVQLEGRDWIARLDFHAARARAQAPLGGAAPSATSPR